MTDRADGKRPQARRIDALLYFLPTAVQSIIPLVTLPIFTRVLSREEYGLWGIATAYAALATGIGNIGLHAAYDRNYFEQRDARSHAELLYSVVAFVTVVLTAGAIVTVILRSVLADAFMGTRPMPGLFLLAYGAAGISSIKMYFLVYLRNEGRAREYVGYSVDELVLGAAIALVAVLVLRVGVAGLILGPLLATAAVTSTVAMKFARELRPAWSRGKLWQALVISLPLSPRVVIGAVGNQLDKLVLGSLGSLAAVGVYTIGQRVAQLVFGYMTALQNVYQPGVYRRLFAGGSESPRLVGRYLAPFSYASVAIALAVTLFAEEIVALLAPPAYASATVVLSILAVHYGLMFFGKQPQLLYARRTAIASVLSVFTVTLTAGAVYVGARAFGAVGAATGVLAAGMITGGVGFLAAQRVAPIAYPWRTMVWIFGALVLSAGAAITMRLLGMPYAPGLAVRFAALAVYVYLGWRSRLLRDLYRDALDLRSGRAQVAVPGEIVQSTVAAIPGP